MIDNGRKIRDWLWWLAAVGGLAACSCWLARGRFYPLDIAASFQHIWLAGVVILAAVLALQKRWKIMAVCVVAASLGAWPLTAGRAARLPEVDLYAPPKPGVIRVVSFNIGPLNGNWREDLERVMSWHADIIALIEVPVELNRAVHGSGVAELRGWGWTHRRWVENRVSACFVLTPGQATVLSTPESENPDDEVYLSDVCARSGRFVTGVTHPHSPRTQSRWRAGNAQVERLCESAEGVSGAIIAADLNGGPASWRAALMRRSGWRQAKPFLGGVGSFPARPVWASMIGLQLDDVWYKPDEYEVVGWTSALPLGSDHRAVVVELVRRRGGDRHGRR